MQEIGQLKGKKTINENNISAYEKCYILDVAGGTGDIAFRI